MPFNFDACFDACVVDFVLKTTVNGVYDEVGVCVGEGVLWVLCLFLGVDWVAFVSLLGESV